MKDYSELKGLPVERKNHQQGLKFKDCYVAEIDDCGLTILGYCTNYGSSNRRIKVFCLRNEIDSHLKMFPAAVKMILNTGVIDGNFEKKHQAVFDNISGGQPICAFE